MGSTFAANTAWTEFWARNAPGADTAGGGGCLPEGHSSVEASQKAVWVDFADTLPRHAQVLDLATGDGRVLGWMLGRRRDLKLTGVDLAPTLPSPPKGCRTRGGIAMEKLPFPNGRYHAVTSQFGFEYGDVEQTADEIVRVLRPGGSVALLVHRGDGPILAHNAIRREQISWVLDDQKLLTQARATLSLGLNGRQMALARAAAVATDAANRFGGSSPAWEIAEAARQTLAMGMNAGAAFVLDTFAALDAKARNEMARIVSLEDACLVADDRAALRAAFAKNRLELVSCEQLREPAGRAFADFLILR